ncbi:MAG: hypothetical protein JRG90_12545 [Deltaproteobacteria bacterium]|nr:hypothetical protein [Deltaproteobacteria bacterium]
MARSYTCLACKRVSHHPEDAKWSWCSACGKFSYELSSSQAVALDFVVADLQRRLRRELAGGNPFSLQFEQFSGEDGGMYWRALVKMGARVWQASTREHPGPTEALLELSHIVDSLEDWRFS